MPCACETVFGGSQIRALQGRQSNGRFVKRKTVFCHAPWIAALRSQ
jgi:hypothetical protein